jgi:tRNA(Ile)-lysidine synthetase-like protein
MNNFHKIFPDILENVIAKKYYNEKQCNDLMKSVNNFLLNHYDRNINYISLSLSGGVDSMVLSWILSQLKGKFGYQIIAIHVDYGNREESMEEASFVEKWCKMFDIIFIKERIDFIKRKDVMGENKGQYTREYYETITRQFRYDLYKKVIQQYGCQGIIYGHHDGDVVENVWSNLMNGRSILDLSVMHPVKINNGVNIWRPMLGFDKNVIYQLAHYHNIPYLKDTTPEWSNRGKLRNEIFPLLDKTIGNKYVVNLCNIGKDSVEWNNYIRDKMIKPLLDKIEICKFGVVIPIDGYSDSPVVFWSEIIIYVFHQMKSAMISRKAVNLLVNALKKKVNCILSLKRGYKFCILDEYILIVKDEFYNNLNGVSKKYRFNIKEVNKIGNWNITFSKYRGEAIEKVGYGDILNGYVVYFSKIEDIKLVFSMSKNKINNVIGGEYFECDVKYMPFVYSDSGDIYKIVVEFAK